ncbi:MAG: hypothetical protein KJ831_03535 [Candidatus Eisenbacteria bacterium]|nr:hypothetical protein [Candidatus Eisenbacteria bacterium]
MGLGLGKWYFGLKTADEVPNWSELSNIANATIGDTIAPSAISDLYIFSFDETSATLVWTAPGDDGDIGQAAEYDLRYAFETISEETWAVANRVQDVPAPEAADTGEIFTFADLETGRAYFVAIKTLDDRSNASGLSNVVSVTPAQDNLPPGQVLDLNTTHAVGHSVTLTWTAPGDNGYAGLAFEYDLRYSQTQITNDSWNEATRILDVSPPGVAGNEESFIVHDLELETPYFFALKTADDTSNWSEMSNVADAITVALAQLTFSNRLAGAFHSFWSLDGRDILFEADYGQEFVYQLYRMPANGGVPSKLTNEPGQASQGAWAPDGNQISFLTTGFGLNELRMVDAAQGSVSSLLLRHEEHRIQDYSWSPDGNYIVYTAHPPDQWDQRRAYILSLSGGATEEILSPDWLPIWVAWSPSGDQICFTSTQNENVDIWVMSSTGEDPTQITFDSAYDGAQAWSPDGSKIAFTSDRTGNYAIWVMSASGENMTQLTFDDEQELYPHWSPDGKAITYTSGTGPFWRGDIWVLYLE